MAKVRGFFYMSNYFEDNFRIIFRYVLEVLNNQCVFKMENFSYFLISFAIENQCVMILFGKL
jgi:hypothetical protein